MWAAGRKKGEPARANSPYDRSTFFSYDRSTFLAMIGVHFSGVWVFVLDGADHLLDAGTRHTHLGTNLFVAMAGKHA